MTDLYWVAVPCPPGTWWLCHTCRTEVEAVQAGAPGVGGTVLYAATRCPNGCASEGEDVARFEAQYAREVAVQAAGKAEL